LYVRFSWYDVLACAEDRAILARNPSADAGGYTDAAELSTVLPFVVASALSFLIW
jgi:hypothetical protein